MLGAYVPISTCDRELDRALCLWDDLIPQNVDGRESSASFAGDGKEEFPFEDNAGHSPVEPDTTHSNVSTGSKLACLLGMTLVDAPSMTD